MQSADGSLTARENLLLSARLYLISRAQRQSRVEAALEEMGLSDAADHRVQTCSGGMIRRLEIAQAMIREPRLLVMDKPTVGLDPVARHAMYEGTRRIRTGGTTILITSHLMEEIEALCDRVGILHRGRLVAAGTPGELETRVGPGAGMDAVFAKLAGCDPVGEGADADARRNRHSASPHSQGKRDADRRLNHAGRRDRGDGGLASPSRPERVADPRGPARALAAAVRSGHGACARPGR